MAEDISNDEVLPPLSSFTGRLDIHNFRFSTGEQLDAQKNPTVPRSSTRPSSRISESFKPTKHYASSKTALPKTKKRKVDDLQDITPLRVTTKTKRSLRGRTVTELSSTATIKFTKADRGGETSSLEKSEHLADELSVRRHITDSLTDDSSVILGEDSFSMTSKQKKKKKRNIPEKPGYAPPSTFAHLPPLPDAMGPNLHVLFCGLNPGIQTAIDGHAYSSPTNRFWKLMYSSGVLPVPCTAHEDRSLPKRFNLGLTNIVERPSRNGSQLSKAEMDAGVPVLEEKVRRWRPEVVCLVGKSIWESVWRVHHNGKTVGKEFNKAFKYGWQDEIENMGLGDAIEKEDGVVYADDWQGARVFVSSSTSGLAATLSPAEKEKIWRELGIWVEKRRAQTKTAVEGDSLVSG